jgi:predicted CoA-binding protein
MNEEACPLPTDPKGTEAGVIRRMVDAKRIAVVGLSDDPSRPSYEVAQYLRSAGKEILPVNPNHKTVMGLPCYPSLAAVPGPIDVVDVFRRPEFCADVARDAVEAGAKGLWLQSGVRSDEAREIARKGGLDFVQDRCLKVEHMFRGE